MADEILKSRHAFGNADGVDAALEVGKIDAYDILFLTDGEKHKIGWIDKDGNKVILEDKKQVAVVESLPETGDIETIYICNSVLSYWNGLEFVHLNSINESFVDTKVEEAIVSANAYTDEQIANAISVIEF